MDHLEILLREYRFRGRARRVRCFAHTLNLTAKATIRQFERKKGKKKKRTDDEDEPDFEGLPLLESIDVDNLEDSDDESDEFELPDLEEIPDLANDEGSEEARKDEEEIVNVFETLTIEEQAQWRAEVKPIRTALYKVRQLFIYLFI
jgi:hypothetical protein